MNRREISNELNRPSKSNRFEATRKKGSSEWVDAIMDDSF